MGNLWSREDIIIAYALYCITPLNKINASNKVIQQVATLIPHSLSSLILRMQNFRYLDPVANQAKQSGLGHVAKMDKIIFEEFLNDWGELSILAEQLTGLALFDSNPLNGAKPISSLTDVNKVSRERHFFRKSVFAAYNSSCCVTQMPISNMLVASHIKPYNKCRSASERTAPTNGLLLNSFYDKAFDLGLMTIDMNLTIHISNKVKEYSHNEFTRQWLIGLDGNHIIRPQRFLPDKECLQYHNDVIFKR